MTATERGRGSARASATVVRDWAGRNAWTLALLGFLVLLFVFTRNIQPTYGVTGVQGLAISVLPLALAAAAQAVVVISGGIDLSIGPMMALTSVVAASRMEDQPAEVGVVVVIGVLVLGLVLGAINGALIVITRVPDIVVTLAMSFVWAGCALLVLRTPGGGSVDWLQDLVRGSIVSEWIPRAAVVLVVVVAVIWIPIQRSRLGPFAVRHRQQPAGRLPQRRGRGADEADVVRHRRAVRRARRADADGQHRDRNAGARVRTR